jgi:hypothetical protein
MQAWGSAGWRINQCYTRLQRVAIGPAPAPRRNSDGGSTAISTSETGRPRSCSIRVLMLVSAGGLSQMVAALASLRIAEEVKPAGPR